MRGAVLLVLYAGAAHAQVEVDREVRVDFYQGPIISSSRVIGLGGAFVSVAEGADGHLINPAAFAVRYAYAAHEWFDWDFAFSWLNLAGDEIDLDQSGTEAAFDDAQLLEAGVNLKFGKHGFGLQVAAQNYKLGKALDGVQVEPITYGQTTGGPGYAYGFYEGELVLGVMISGGNAQVRLRDEDTKLAEISGAGLIVGGLFKPFDAQWRLGATVRSEIIGADFDGDPEAGATLVPTEVVVPWQVAIGASRMWGDRIYNVRPTYGRAGTVQTGGRRYILAAIDLVLTGAVKNGVSAQSFLDGEPRPSGRRPTPSVRGGVESEVIADLLTVRGGSYWEPSRHAKFDGRVHGTAGIDYHFSLWWEWKAAAVIDVAADYVNAGLGVGFWH